MKLAGINKSYPANFISKICNIILYSFYHNLYNGNSTFLWNYSLFYAFNNSIGKCNIYSIIKSRQFKIIIYLYIQSYKNIF